MKAKTEPSVRSDVGGGLGAIKKKKKQHIELHLRTLAATAVLCVARKCFHSHPEIFSTLNTTQPL